VTVDVKLPQIGSCRCGEVMLEVAKAPIMTAACHCRGCQKMSASAFSLTAMVPAEGFRVVSGDVVKGGIQGPELDHYVCPFCKTWMFTRITGFDAVVNVRPTLFEVAEWTVPFIETMTSARLPWVRIPVQHSFDGMPDPAQFPALLAAYATRI